MRFIEILFNEYIEILCFCYLLKESKNSMFFFYINKIIFTFYYKIKKQNFLFLYIYIFQKFKFIFI